MSDQGFATPALEGVSVKNKSLFFKVKLSGHTTQGSVTAQITGTPGMLPYLASASLTAPADATFTSLISFTAPAVIGFYLTVGNALRVHDVVVAPISIKSPSMTAGVVTLDGATSAISGKTGVTTGKNIAFQISHTTLDLDAQISDHEYSLRVDYDTE